MKMLFKNPKLWWKFEGRYYHKDLYRGIKNLLKWIPVIWKDRNWDHTFIYDIFEHKLKLQSEYIGKYGNHVTAKRDAEIMMVCVKLIQRLKDGYYDGENHDYHKTKYWFEDIEDKPGYSTMESELLEENFDDYFKKYPLIHKRVLNGEGVFNIQVDDEGERKERVAMNISRINHDRARKLLFKIMEENIEKWWD